MITIMKASAGSGKTFNLAKKYIELLFRSHDPAAYRHILAVTFTNKATDEMKGRILQKLNVLATDPRSSGYFDDFVPAVFASEDELRRCARRCLSAILHDYGAFAVSTIDRFFQQTLRAFAHEIGRFASYQVELDKKSLVTESADRFLDSITERDAQVLRWLTDGAIKRMSEGGRFRLDEAVEEYAVDVLCSDSYAEMAGRTGADESVSYSRENLSRIRGTCRRMLSSYRESVASAARKAVSLFGDAGIPLDRTYYRFMCGIESKYAGLKPDDKIEPPSDRTLKIAADPMKWFSKAEAAKWSPCTTPEMESALAGFAGLFGKDYDVYRTAEIIDGQLYGLGVVADISRELSALMKEKNVMALKDSDSILRKIIDGSDTPFIYEKTGVRYHNFLLDEFQDTSFMQWSNFLPLVRNSEAQGFESLIVGDVKQSIYRWRGSDWHLLNTGLQREFGIADDDVVSLQDNYRTLREIVEFNNGFFGFAAGEADRLAGVDPSSPDSVSRIYGDVRQRPRTGDDAPGSVEVVFCGSEEAEMDEILKGVRAVKDAGGEYGMTAVLVRKNDMGAAVADMLVKNGIPVVSDDSLKVKSSVTVRRLAALLSYMDNPDDGINAYLAAELGVRLPENHYPLAELCELLAGKLRELDGELFRREIPYVLTFLDKVLEWTSSNGNDLGAFLKWWRDEDAVISSSESSGAVRIMTIHKAKGLEFPYVIVPFAEKMELSDSLALKWCTPAAEGTGLESVGHEAYRVRMSGKAQRSLFAEDYEKEMRLQFIDGINIFYVALTRAEKGLKIIAAAPSEKATAGKSPARNNMATLLHAYVAGRGLAQEDDGTLRYTAGTAYDFGSPLLRGKTVPFYDGDRDFFPAAADGRLRLASGEMSPERLHGIAMHDILSRVKKASDLGPAVAAAVMSGLLTEEEKDSAERFLRGRIESVAGRGWFPEDGAGVFNETSFFGRDGLEYRPDRVVIRDGAVAIIDYKFGAREPGHRRQVMRYAGLFRDMGYSAVSAYLWYFGEEDENAVEEICH